MDDQQPVAPPPQVPDPAPGHPPYPYPYSPPFNTYAILSLVFALMVFPPLGVYFGNKARQEIARTGERGAELATAGIVLGWIFTALFVVLMVVWCGLFVTLTRNSTV
ncbi:MAG TPA: DUF4190 domain-containing protein [Micromonospora sp.]